MLFIYLLMLACAAGLAVFIYRYDLCAREPWYMVALAVGLGFAVIWMAGAAEDLALAELGVGGRSLAPKAAVVATIETIARMVMVFTVATLFRPRFTDPLDGLMYGTLGGLGMAIEESLLYLSLAPATPHTLGAEVVRLFAHSLMGGLVGFSVGQWLRPNQRPAPRPVLTVGCLAVALLVHFSWDYIAYQASRAALLRLLPMLLMLSLMLVWGGLVAYATEQLRGKAQGAGASQEEANPAPGAQVSATA
jgi:RsiW-degrading membrane proteinase PrsW (M82 family)